MNDGKFPGSLIPRLASEETGIPIDTELKNNNYKAPEKCCSS
jgi:hypothetical protein